MPVKSNAANASKTAQKNRGASAADPLWVGLVDDVASGWYSQDADELFCDFKIVAEDVVLDVGCGSGGGSAKFCGDRGAHVICVDVDEDKIKNARAILNETQARLVPFFVSDSNPLPLQSETASKVICMEVLEHVDDPVQFLSELVRVGRPGALYLITIPDAKQECLQKSLAPASYFEKPNHIRIIEPDKFVEMVQSVGLEIQVRDHHGFYSALQWAMFWACNQQYSPPWHSVLTHWARTWEILLSMEGGNRVKRILDDCLPKCQVLVARKPVDMRSSHQSVRDVQPSSMASSRRAVNSLLKMLQRTALRLTRRSGTSSRIETDFLNEDIQAAMSVDAQLSGWFNEKNRELLSGFMVTAEDTVLDIGCGDAPFIHFCADQGAEVIFADIDPAKVAAVELALQNSKARIKRPLVTDGNPLQLTDDSVTKVVVMEVLEHVDNPALFMKELVRVAKPGAQFLITVPDALSEATQKELAHESYFKKPNHIRVFERDVFERLIIDSGLVIERRVFYGFFWAVWWCFFWVCKQDLGAPWHPLLESWGRTWACLLRQSGGAKIKSVLDAFMPKSQAIIARKP